MKRVAYALVTALALVAVLSTAALADCGSCGGDKHHAKKAEGAVEKVAAKMGKCCVAAAKAGKGCCGKSAAEVKAAFAKTQGGCSASCAAAASCKVAGCEVTQAAMKDMHKCCAAALTEGKGCCGKDAEALKASFEGKVAMHQAKLAEKVGMHKCCAKAVTAGKGCCGKDAKALKASFEEKVKKAEKKKLADKAKASL